VVHDYYLQKIQNEIKSFKKWKEELTEKQKEKIEKKPEDKQIEQWLEEIFIKPLCEEKAEVLMNKEKNIDFKMFYPQDEDFNCLQQYLPQNSALMKISFTLKKPFMSKDDSEFHILNGKILENFIVRDKLTGLSMVKPSTWKGHLRFAAEMVKKDKAEREKIMKRLFGSEADDTEALRGRIYFFPTFFKENHKKGEVITPLDRETRTPSIGPIDLEVIAAGGKGILHLLYFPYPRGEDYSDKEVEEEEEDLKFLADSLQLMLYTSGFSAKKTSGFGVIEKLHKQDVEVIPESFREYFSALWSS